MQMRGCNDGYHPEIRGDPVAQMVAELFYEQAHSEISSRSAYAASRHLSDIGPDTDMVNDLEGDSLNVALLADRLEKMLGMEIPGGLEEYRTVSSVVDLLKDEMYRVADNAKNCLESPEPYSGEEPAPGAPRTAGEWLLSLFLGRWTSRSPTL